MHAYTKFFVVLSCLFDKFLKEGIKPLIPVSLDIYLLNS